MSRIIQETSPQYRPSQLAHIFHSFPHLNVSLHLVNSTFAPESELYLESLGILGSIPAAWLILTLFLLLLYLMTRCCDRKPRPKHSIVVLKWTLAIFAVLCCGAVGVSLYGNDDLHNGLVAFLTAAKSLNEKINLVKNQTNSIERSLKTNIQEAHDQLRDKLEAPVQNITANQDLTIVVNAFLEKRDETLKSVRELTSPLEYVSLSHIIKLVHMGESIRWPITMVMMCLLLMFCIVLLFGVARHSRYALILFSVVGLFAVILSWLLSSLYLAIAVATGDFCVKPDIYIEHKSPPNLPTDILFYYMSCDSALSNPFSEAVTHGSQLVDDMNIHLTNITRMAKNLFGDQVHEPLNLLAKEVYHTSNLMSVLNNEFKCDFYRSKYVDILKAICYEGLMGLSFMLIASIVSGFFFTILVWLDSHTWIYIRKKQDYARVDEQDPFLPPSAASQAVAARTLRNQGRDVGLNGGNGSAGGLRAAGIHPIGTISHQRLGLGGAAAAGSMESGQYATLSRKFRTLEHPSRGGRHMVSFDTVSSSHTLGHGHKKHHHQGGGAGNHQGKGDGSGGAGQYSTLSRKCKTLESNDFY